MTLCYSLVGSASPYIIDIIDFLLLLTISTTKYSISNDTSIVKLAFKGESLEIHKMTAKLAHGIYAEAALRIKVTCAVYSYLFNHQ